MARAFNLSAEQLHGRIVERWVRDQIVELDERRWAPERSKLKIYEAPELDPGALGLDRGWANVTRTGEDVTDTVLSAARAGLSEEKATAPAPAVAELKQRLLDAITREPIPLSRIPPLTGAPGARASERLAIAEEAVWELLHERRARLLEKGSEAGPERWEPIVLGWQSWAADPGDILLAG